MKRVIILLFTVASACWSTGDFLLDVDWKYKNSYASVRCLKD